MSILLFDSYSGEKKDITKNVTDNTIKIYGCGVTVYDHCHIGHGRVFVVYDLLIRFLREAGYNVIAARNITDIDDKIIKKSQDLGQSCSQITAQYTSSMHEDLHALNCTDVEYEPKATESIDSMLSIIKILIEKGHAYVVDGEVLFSIASFSQYGLLSGQKLKDLEHGHRVSSQEYKRNPGDFTLWKPSKEGEPSWDSPWGKGRPGWHIECSAMIEKVFSASLDIHLGGADLKFPHHENEIAQSECCFEKTLSHAWMHIGFVKVKDEKMSKSLNNFVTLKDLLEKHSANTIRVFYLMTHYRQPLAFSSETLEQAKNTYESIKQGLKIARDYQPSTPIDLSMLDLNQCLYDDLNFPNLLAHLFKKIKDLNTLDEEKKIQEAYIIKSYCERLLGLTFDWQQQDNKIVPDHVLAIAQKRYQYRKEKNWSEADLCRQQIQDLGWDVLDTQDGFEVVERV